MGRVKGGWGEGMLARVLGSAGVLACTAGAGAATGLAPSVPGQTPPCAVHRCAPEEDAAPPRPPLSATPRARPADVPEIPGPPADADLTPELKAAATAYVDALRTLCYDSTMVAAMSLKLPPDAAPVTPESKAAIQQARRARQRLRDALRDLREGPVRDLRAIPGERLVQASRALAADLRLLADADLRALDQVQDLLAQTGADKYVAFAKAAHILKDLETGERGARRKATLKAIMALKGG